MTSTIRTTEIKNLTLTELPSLPKQKLKKNELVSVEKLAQLPRQVLQHFPNATEEDKIKLAMIYDGPKKEPTFLEWLEHYQTSELFKLTIKGSEWVLKLKEKLQEKIKEYEKIKDTLNEEEDKQHRKEINRQNKFIESISGQHLDFTKELNKLVQNNLTREAPKKLEVTQHKVTPGDVANLIYQAKKNIINVTPKND